MSPEDAAGEARLILFGRYPVPGRAKTRLIPAIGAFNAADLHRRFAERAFRAVRRAAAQCGAEAEFRFDGGDERRIRRWLGDRLRLARQGSGDLGERMGRAFAGAFHEGCSRVVLVGTDVPALEGHHLAAALRALDRNDVVIGPSTDGGYWLIGMKGPYDVFRNVEWGGGEVLGQTLAQAAALRLKASCLAPETDVDTPEDLRNWDSEEARQRPYLTVVIPTLNEDHMISGAVKSAMTPGAEIIVVDGGSRDETISRAADAGAVVKRSPRGRASQQNRGAALARGRVLLFLHADTRLPADYGREVFEVLMDRRVALGAFRFRTDFHTPVMRWVEMAANARARWLWLPYGDQALFLRKEDFHAVGGFPELPIAEDLALVRRLSRRGSVRIASAEAVTSGRRWRSLGVFRTSLINWGIAWGCLLGVSAHRLAPLYRIDIGRKRDQTVGQPKNGAGD